MVKQPLLDACNFMPEWALFNGACRVTWSVWTIHREHVVKACSSGEDLFTCAKTTLDGCDFMPECSLSVQ